VYENNNFKIKKTKKIIKTYFFKNKPNFWERVVDFTEINKKGISIEKIISRL